VLFNDLVRLSGEVGRHFDAERLGGLEVDDELKFGGLNYRQVPWFLALENPPGIDAGLTIALADVGTIAYQAAGQRVFTLVGHRGDSVSRRQSDYSIALTVEERIRADQHRSGLQLHRTCKCRIDFALITR